MKTGAGCVALALVMLLAGGVGAAPLTVGSGSSSAYVYVEWGDSFVAEFDVFFDEPNRTGLQLFDIIQADTTLSTERQDFGFGEFIDGISFLGHSDAGAWTPETPEAYWHYWLMNDGEVDWTMSPIGAVDRIVLDGDSDAWIYGRAGAVPEPATMALLGLGGLLLRRRTRRS